MRTLIASHCIPQLLSYHRADAPDLSVSGPTEAATSTTTTAIHIGSVGGLKREKALFEIPPWLSGDAD